MIDQEKIDKLKLLSQEIADFSDEYENNSIVQETNEAIEHLEEKLSELRGPLSGKEEEYEELKKELIEEFVKNKIDSFSGVSTKTTKKNAVNISRVIEAIGGDLDMLFMYAKLTQTDFTKMKKKEKSIDFPKDCVEVVSEVVSDLIIEND